MVNFGAFGFPYGGGPPGFPYHTWGEDSVYTRGGGIWRRKRFITSNNFTVRGGGVNRWTNYVKGKYRRVRPAVERKMKYKYPDYSGRVHRTVLRGLSNKWRRKYPGKHNWRSRNRSGYNRAIGGRGLYL